MGYLDKTVSLLKIWVYSARERESERGIKKYPGERDTELSVKEKGVRQKDQQDISSSWDNNNKNLSKWNWNGTSTSHLCWSWSLPVLLLFTTWQRNISSKMLMNVSFISLFNVHLLFHFSYDCVTAYFWLTEDTSLKTCRHTINKSYVAMEMNTDWIIQLPMQQLSTHLAIQYWMED